MTETKRPGEKGSDVLVLLWHAQRRIFRPVAGLYRACGDGAPQVRPGMMVGGRGIVRDRMTVRLFERLARDAAVRRWRVVDADGTVVEGRYRLVAFGVTARGDFEVPCTMTLAPERSEARPVATAAAQTGVCV